MVAILVRQNNNFRNNNSIYRANKLAVAQEMKMTKGITILIYSKVWREIYLSDSLHEGENGDFF